MFRNLFKRSARGPDDAAAMNGITFRNRTGRKLTLIIEPIAEEYLVEAGDTVELRPPLYLDHRKIIDIELVDDLIIVYADEDVSITRNGKRVPRENSESVEK
jgi:hypothetical protein